MNVKLYLYCPYNFHGPPKQTNLSAYYVNYILNSGALLTCASIVCT